jgi:phosphate/sulfate permease
MPKVIIPMFTSPILGILIGFVVMGLLYVFLQKWRPRKVNSVFGKAQLLSSAWMGFSHGLNDAQKTMGIIALALVAATSPAGRSTICRRCCTFSNLRRRARAGASCAGLDQGGVRA